MSAFRRLPVQRHSVALLLAFALLVKLLVPVGWMPAFDGRGVHLELCGSYGPPPPAMAEAMADAAHRMSGDEHKHHGKASADQPCAYAGLAFAMAEPVLPALAAPAIVTAAPLAFAAAVAIGRGLAAPPPPATGPPSRA
ncbi:MAG TPA: DUF2946 family protein [Sphingomonas sp.]|nr:DUF2946 family protein [Sphingomonas sp.]